MKTRLMTLLLVSIPCVVIDQASKYWATATLKDQPGQSYLDGIFRMQYALNPGAWGGIGDSLPLPMRKLVFTIGVGIFLAILTWYILSKVHPKLVTLGLSFILAGGIGNLIDRALYGHVVDFLYLGYEPIGWLHTNIFNVADMAIMAGGGILLVHALTHREPEAKPDQAPAAEALAADAPETAAPEAKS